MHYIEIKSHRTNGVVKVEMYNTDTEGVGGLAIEACDLWRWLSQCRPCQVHLRGRDYLLRRPTRATGWSISNGIRGYERLMREQAVIPEKEPDMRGEKCRFRTS